MLKKILTAIVFFIVCVPTCAIAQSVNIKRDIEAASFEISGKTDAGASVSVIVFAPGKSESDLDFDLPMNTIKHQREVYADESGNYSLSVELSGDSGVYIMRIQSGTHIETRELEFVDKDKNAYALSRMDTGNLQVYIDSNRNDLGFFNPLYDEVDKSKVCTMLGAKINEVKSDPEAAAALFDEAVIAMALYEGKISGIMDYADRLSVLNNNSKMAVWYAKVAPENIDKKLTKTYSTLEEFENMLSEAIIRQVVETPNGYLNIKNVIRDFSELVGIENPTDKDSVYQSIATQKYFENCRAILSAYNNALSASDRDRGAGSGSGSGSGGSSLYTGSIIGNASDTEAIIKNPSNSNPEPITINKFSDMNEAQWAAEAVNYLFEKGIVSGKSETEFAPNDYISREEFVVLIARAFALKKYAAQTAFTDISESDWFYEYVCSAEQSGIINGVLEDKFGTGANIIRQDMAVILERTMNMTGIALSYKKKTAEFSDSYTIAEYAKESVMSLYRKGIINGFGDNRFGAAEPSTRAQSAQMIYKILTESEEQA